MSPVFPRVLNRTLPTAVSAEGAWIVDADGKRYLDGAGGRDRQSGSAIGDHR
jgi:4-aminobutyrate aminotransferase-like enzyme